MKKYLIRAGFNPFVKYSPIYALTHNMLGGNSGNLMYTYGVMNVLSTPDVMLIPTYHKHKWDEAEIEYINQECEAFILPLADAFRKDFEPELKEYIELIKKLKIPCIVIGVGLRAEFEPDLSSKFEFDDTVYEFVSTVLEHSEMLGLRGGITAQYLQKLGFIPEKDFTVIGCPSLYMHGNDVQTKEIKENIERVAVNTNTLAPKEASRFLVDCFYEYSDVYLVQQKRQELKHMYLGAKGRSVEHVFPEKDFEMLNRENRIKFFVDVPSWLRFMEEMDLFVGNRFHGTVAAILAGVPQIFIPFDARTRELTEYHSITHLNVSDIDKNKNVCSIIEKLDFRSFEKNHSRNLKHYIDFLHTNRLCNVFKEKCDIRRGCSPMEKHIFESTQEEISCAASIDEYEVALREHIYKSDRFVPR